MAEEDMVTTGVGGLHGGGEGKIPAIRLLPEETQVVRGLACYLQISCTRFWSVAKTARQRREAKALRDKRSESTANPAERWKQLYSRRAVPPAMQPFKQPDILTTTAV